MSKRICIFLLPLCFFLSCDDSLVFPIEPEIEFVDIQPREIRQFTDPLTITFRFTDGDGDLGDDGNDESDENLIVVDNRTHFPDSLRTIAFTLPNLTPDTRRPSIQGTVTITYPPTALTPGDTMEMIDYTIYVYDRAGHKSNEIVTAPITLRR